MDQRVNKVLRLDGAIVEPAPAVTITVVSDDVQDVGKLNDHPLIPLDFNRLFDDQALDTVDQSVKQAA
jgi:chemotaxis signal transduction protein